MTGHPKQFEIYQDEKQDWRWSLRAQGGKPIAIAAEGYATKADCIHGAIFVGTIAAGARIWNRDAGAWES